MSRQGHGLHTLAVFERETIWSLMGVRGSAPRTVDLLVIGGGINGTGIARDAAGRGAASLTPI